jgi:hypothetical protein
VINEKNRFGTAVQSNRQEYSLPAARVVMRRSKGRLATSPNTTLLSSASSQEWLDFLAELLAQAAIDERTSAKELENVRSA